MFEYQIKKHQPKILLNQSILHQLLPLRIVIGQQKAVRVLEMVFLLILKEKIMVGTHHQIIGLV